MSWGGILERIQVDAVDLLSNPVDSNKLDRKYILALASLLDEPVALQVLQNRKDAGWCSSWLCTSTKNHKESCDKLKSQLEMNQQDQQQQQQNSSLDSNNRNKQQLLTLLKYSFCCSDKCKATLKVLLQRANDFDPSSPEVAQSLFKIFPNAQAGVDGLMRASSTSSAKNNTNNQSNGDEPISKNNTNVAAAAPSSSSSLLSFQIKEKNTNKNDKVVQKPNDNNNNAIPNSNLVFSALDPRISVIVLADLLLPSSLKQQWTFGISKLHHPHNAHPVQRQLLHQWIGNSFCSLRNNNNNNGNDDDNNNNSSESSSLFEPLFNKCDEFADQNPQLLEKLQLQREHKNQLEAETNTRQHLSADVIKMENNRIRAKSMASEILTSLILEESKKAALLLRLDSEMPVEFREKIDEFLDEASLPSPIPYEDSKDTWLLFIIMLFIVNAISDPRFGAFFLHNSDSVKDIFEAYCVDEARGKEILEAFLAI